MSQPNHQRPVAVKCFNPLRTATDHSNAVIGTLAVEWAVTFGTARRELGGAAVPKYAPPINSQCTITVLLYNGRCFSVLTCPLKG